MVCVFILVVHVLCVTPSLKERVEGRVRVMSHRNDAGHMNESCHMNELCHIEQQAPTQDFVCVSRDQKF